MGVGHAEVGEQERDGFVTLIASFLGVNGLTYTGNRANDIIALLLQALVVVPTLIACAFWVWGFRERR